MEECFNGLVKAGFDAETLRKKLNIEYEDPQTYQRYEKEIWEYIEDRGIWKVLQKMEEFENTHQQVAHK